MSARATLPELLISNLYMILSILYLLTDEREAPFDVSHSI